MYYCQGPRQEPSKGQVWATNGIFRNNIFRNITLWILAWLQMWIILLKQTVNKSGLCFEKEWTFMTCLVCNASFNNLQLQSAKKTFIACINIFFTQNRISLLHLTSKGIKNLMYKILHELHTASHLDCGLYFIEYTKQNLFKTLKRSKASI